MFPPKKPSPGIGPGGPQQGPPQGGAPAGPPQGPPHGLPPFLAHPSQPRPGQGMDPAHAMTHGLGPDIMGQLSPPSPPGHLAPMGGNGLPIGGSMPPPGPDGDNDMGGSDLLQALAGAIGGGSGDPYDEGRFPPSLNVGPGDPNMGLEQMLQALALAQMGVGGSPGAGSSGAPFDNSPSMGGMAGLF